MISVMASTSITRLMLGNSCLHHPKLQHWHVAKPRAVLHNSGCLQGIAGVMVLHGNVTIEPVIAQVLVHILAATRAWPH